MTIKIDAPRTIYERLTKAFWGSHWWYGDGTPATESVRIVRESDYRKLMKLVRACEEADGGIGRIAANGTFPEIAEALDTLREKRK